MLTQQLVKALFDYDPETGYLIWTSTGKVAGTVDVRYIKIGVHWKKFFAHQIVWLWHNGYMPNYIDHIDGNGYNNKIENLRECNQSQNMGNARWSEMRGIEKHGRKWRVRICGGGWKRELGSYETLEEAIAARNVGYREYFGDFFTEP